MELNTKDISVDQISEFLGTETGMAVPEDVKSEIAEVRHNNDDVVTNAKDDYENVRRSLLELIVSGTASFDKLIKVANESESPRAFEVLSNMMRTLAEVNRDLMQLHKDAKEITAPKEETPADSGGGGDTIVFQGSTEELQKFLKTRKKEMLDNE